MQGYRYVEICPVCGIPNMYSPAMIKCIKYFLPDLVYRHNKDQAEISVQLVDRTKPTGLITLRLQIPKKGRPKYFVDGCSSSRKAIAHKMEMEYGIAGEIAFRPYDLHVSMDTALKEKQSVFQLVCCQ